MQLKLRRSMGAEGVFTKAKYVLDVVMLPTDEEKALLSTYRCLADTIWSFTKDKRRDGEDGDEVWNKLTSTKFQKLIEGAHFEYLDYRSVTRTEDDITEACQRVLAYCRTLATFNGSERVIELTADDAALAARG